MLHNVNIFWVEDAKSQDPQLVGRHGWKSSNLIDLFGNEASKWDHYISLMVSNFIRLNPDVHDELCWSKNHHFEEFTVKLGYKVEMETKFEGKKYWWWKILWNLSTPLKCKITS